MNLIIVESPTKAKTLSRFLGKDYRVASTMGHIRDLPKKKLGIDVEQNFEPEYVAVEGRQKTIAELKKLAKVAKKIFLATDPDREGEAIAWHAAIILGKYTPGESTITTPEVERITFHEITKSAIKKALACPGRINMKLVDAQQARRVLDRLVGYKLSPLLWRKIRRGLSAGRVQSVAVRLVVDREREIEKFKAEEYWEIWARLKRHLGGRLPEVIVFAAKLSKENGRKIKVINANQARKITTELKSAGYEVAGVDKKEIRQNPPPPFTTSILQQQSVYKFGFSAKRTMRAAQSLYEKGLITYHRTDSLNIASEAVLKIREYINSIHGKKYLPEEPRFYKTKSKVAQEAHEAIRPTDVKTQVSNFRLPVAADEQKLYGLIWKRTMACQMAAAIWDQTRIEVQAAGEKNLYTLLAEGRVMKFDGWRRLFEFKSVGDKSPSDNGLSLGKGVFPELSAGDELNLVKVNAEQKFTQPPPRYTEATLIKTLEEKGIGRPSTYAPIISTVQIRQYVEKPEGKFFPTPLGTTVNDFLVEYFPDVFDYAFTAQMETELDEIAGGKRKWRPVVGDFYRPFDSKLEGVLKAAQRVQVPVETIGEKCPECKEGQLVIRTGRFGKFISCSRFPDCKYTSPFVDKLKGAKCEKCGAEVVIKKTKKGRQFYGCANYPKCDWASWRKPTSIPH